jgi:hypothetical protein
MPFAILRYDPAEEYALRRQLRLLAHSLEQEQHWRVTFLSLADFVWKAIRKHEGTDYLFQTESQRGFLHAQRHVQSLISPGKFSPLADQLYRLSRMSYFSCGQAASRLLFIEAPLSWMSFITAFRSPRSSAIPAVLPLERIYVSMICPWRGVLESTTTE